MIHFFLVFVVLILLVAILGLSVVFGRRVGVARLTEDVEHKLAIVGAAENAVFGLLGLLLAFTFAGAYDRYEHRKMHIIDEASAFTRAYEYIDLVPKDLQEILRIKTIEYMDTHIKSYQDIPNYRKVEDDREYARMIQDLIWKSVVDAGEESANKAFAQIYIPAFSEMFDASEVGINMTQIHPPAIIFILLIVLAALGGFLVGYNSAETKKNHHVHTLSYVLLTSFIIYIVINIEFPRSGFIRFSNFDQVLVEAREHME